MYRHSYLKEVKLLPIPYDDYPFWCFIISLFLIDYMVFDTPELAMWFGFAVAGFSAIANDSIQTLGTFIASNKKLPWYGLHLFIGGVLVLTLTTGWLYSGELSFGRLSAIPSPTHYTYLKLATPIFLLIMTRFRMPVSTTFLLLSVFSSHMVIKQMIVKSFVGYGLSFVLAYVIWAFLSKTIQHLFHSDFDNYNKTRWRILQFIVTGGLWSIWIMHDMANIVVFLPRQVPTTSLLMVLVYLFFTVGFIMYHRGGRIQKIVSEKVLVKDIRQATIIDFIYAIILIIFKEWSHVPMSTTWVFLGLLAGRELAYKHYLSSDKSTQDVIYLISKDFFRAGLGLLISLLISLSV